MLGALVDVPDLGIAEGRIIAQIDRLGGYSIYRVQYNPKAGEINPTTIGVHEPEMEVVDESKVQDLQMPEFDLGDEVVVKHPISVKGVVTGIYHSLSGCVEYEVDYATEKGIKANILPGPLLEKIGVAAEPGDQKGSMIRSAERRM